MRPFCLRVRQLIWALLLKRSPVHQIWAPNRRNTALSLFLIILMLPLSFLILPILALRVLLVGKITIYELKPYGEFAFLVYMFERIRGNELASHQRGIILIRAPFRHKGLTHLYRSHLHCPVYWSSGANVLLAQVMLLQPSLFVDRIALTTDDFVRYGMVDEPVTPSVKLTRLRNKTLAKQDVDPSRYVALAVYTSTLEEKHDPGYSWKSVVRETVGTQLARGVDFLKSSGVDLVMLGFPDTGEAHVPRKFPRLADFGRIGGLHEVALASGCLYFWADDVGAQWLREPFKKPVLLTNAAEVFGPKRYFSEDTVRRFMSVPIRFQSAEGHLLTIREQLSMSSRRFEAFAKGEIRIIRNSPDDIVEAHKEMLSRVDGTWVVEDQVQEMYERLEKIYSEFPQYPNRLLPTGYLLRYSYLLD